MIRAIIFDCFGVLTTDTWRAFLDQLPQDANIQRARELNRAVDAGLITHTDFLAQIQELTGKQPPNIETMQGGVIKNDQLLEYIKTLKPEYKIGLLSNISSDWIRDSFLTTTEQSLFDDMVFSHNVGMTKPDPRIFQLACEKLGTRPEETIMIDDIASYCAAAETIGMQAVTYHNFQQCKTDLDKLLTKKIDKKLEI